MVMEAGIISCRWTAEGHGSREDDGKEKKKRNSYNIRLVAVLLFT